MSLVKIAQLISLKVERMGLHEELLNFKARRKSEDKSKKHVETWQCQSDKCIKIYMILEKGWQ